MSTKELEAESSIGMYNDYEYTVETTVPSGVLVHVRENQDEGLFRVTPQGDIQAEPRTVSENGIGWALEAISYLDSQQIVAEAYNRVD